MKLPNYHPDQSKTVQNTGIETQPDKATAIFIRLDQITRSKGGKGERKETLSSLHIPDCFSYTEPDVTECWHIAHDLKRELIERNAEHAALEAVAEAMELFYQFYFNDLAKNNKGFMAKLAISDYGAMNDAYIAVEKSRANLAAIRKESK